MPGNNDFKHSSFKNTSIKLEENWDGIERRGIERRNTPSDQSCQICLNNIENFILKKDEENRKFYTDQLDKKLDQKFEEYKEYLGEAFPNKDLVAHRLAHEKYITDADFWKGIKEKVITGVLTAVLVAVLTFVAAATWLQFLKGPSSQQDNRPVVQQSQNNGGQQK